MIVRVYKKVLKKTQSQSGVTQSDWLDGVKITLVEKMLNIGLSQIHGELDGVLEAILN